jgi:hypothetical protein
LEDGSCDVWEVEAGADIVVFDSEEPLDEGFGELALVRLVLDTRLPKAARLSWREVCDFGGRTNDDDLGEGERDDEGDAD